MDFESMDIGWGVFFSPAKGQFGFDPSGWPEAANHGSRWAFRPTRTGTYTFFCRIHPFMRGVIKVVK